MTKTHETVTLYKKTSTGKIQTWKGEVYGDYFTITTGYDDGKKTTSKPKYCKAKNVGKSNEVSPEDQALKEVLAKADKKLNREGYFQDKEDAENHKVVMPMLAQKYKDRAKHIEFPCAIQRKYDGIRCFIHCKPYEVLGHAYPAYKITALTRKNTPFSEDIQNFVVRMLGDLGTHMDSEVYLDGEFYSDEMSLQELAGLSRRETNSPEQLKELEEKAFFQCYDAYFPGQEDLEFVRRFEWLKSLVKFRQNFDPKVSMRFTPTYQIEDEAQIKLHHDHFVKEGYEGVIIRNLESLYAPDKRSNDLQKYKEFDDGEFKIVGFTEGEGNEAGCIIWTCQTEEGNKFNVRPKGTREDRSNEFNTQTLLEDLNGEGFLEEMNKKLTVRHFGWTADGIPFQPVGLEIRDYEG